MSDTPVPLPVPQDPGPATTEFWLTLFTNLISAVVAMASLFGHVIDKNTLLGLVPFGAMLAAAIASGFYAHSRGKVKAAAIQGQATIMATVKAKEADALMQQRDFDNERSKQQTAWNLAAAQSEMRKRRSTSDTPAAEKTTAAAKKK